jgi:hypothetical protein
MVNWRIFLLTFAWSLVALAAGVPRCMAATVEPYESLRCSAKLEGDIADGDVARLRAHEFLDDKVRGLCLNSKGGSYGVALEMAKYVLNEGIPTIIEAGDHCYSGCALVFMMGSYYTEGGGIDRHLSKRGKLGFHAPYQSNDVDQLDDRTLQRAYKAGVEAIGKLMEIIRRSSSWDKANVIPTTLLAKVLSTGPSEVYYIDTVERALAAKIDISEVGTQFGIPETIGTNHICNACRRSDSSDSNFRFGTCVSEEQAHLLSRVGEREEWQIRVYGAEDDTTDCKVTINRGAPTPLSDFVQVSIYDGEQRTLGPLALYDDNQLLANIPDPPLSPPARTASARRAGESCNSKTEYSNLRDQAGSSGSKIVARLPNGTHLDVTGEDYSAKTGHKYYKVQVISGQEGFIDHELVMRSCAEVMASWKQKRKSR